MQPVLSQILISLQADLFIGDQRTQAENKVKNQTNIQGTTSIKEKSQANTFQNVSKNYAIYMMTVL